MYKDQSDKQDPDPDQGEKQDPDPDPHQGDADPQHYEDVLRSTMINTSLKQYRRTVQNIRDHRVQHIQIHRFLFFNKNLCSAGEVSFI